MKRFVTRTSKETARRIITGVCVASFVLASALGASKSKAPSNASKSAAPVKVNRTVPNVQPPKGGLQFSAKPTPDELFRARVFEEPLVPIGGKPNEAENAALTSALTAYSKRSGPDDFASLTGFLEKFPSSPWRAALLTDLGLEYYNTAHYSLALEAWTKAWTLAKDATDAKGKGIGDRAVGELAYMYARLGRMNDLEPLLQSVGDRMFVGPATERISGARAGLSNMKDRPEIAFRCGPLALHRIKLLSGTKNAGDTAILNSASTQKGFSLPQVADLSQKVGLKYQMAFREKGAPIVVPSVVHWKVGHYAAVVRQEGDRFLIQDPTFQNDVWATREALEAEGSGYFLIPSGKLKQGWRAVDAKEGGAVWGKGNVCCKDDHHPRCDDKKNSDPCGKPDCKGMASASVFLMNVSLNITDEPVGYVPPVGPPITFAITYNQREAHQPTTFSYSNFGPKWTFDWLAYITDNPLSAASDVTYFALGGGTDVFTGFNSATQTYAYEQYHQTRLTRISASSYEMVAPDGSKKVFGQSDGSTGTTRRIFLTQIIDPFGNTVSLTYDSYFRLVAVTDAIGQVSTLSYANPTDFYKIRKITDPFGRFAAFDYDSSGRLIKITDVIGITSQFTYESTGDFINSLITPYGTTTFIKAESGTTASLDTIYPNGERDRVEFNQSTNLGIPQSVLASQLPAGMNTHNDYMSYRNTYYWDKIAYAAAYPDYTKAKIYHWLHTADIASAAGILESTKEPLEGRVWNDYSGQPIAYVVGNSSKPNHVGRVLDDGTTQLYTYEYDSFGHVTKAIDPIGRTTSYIYDPNGIDLLETRQTRSGNNELLSKITYNSQHLPLTFKDAAGQITTRTYNARGQLLTLTNAKNETTTIGYDSNGYALSFNGALPGNGDTATFTYDSFGRVRTTTDLNGDSSVFDYDALDRLTKITFPDATFKEYTYTLLDETMISDRAGRQTLFEYDSIRQLSKRTDPLGRVTLFEWCKCGGLKSLTDPMRRTTSWRNDVQGRVTSKEYTDGSKVSYLYENSTSRLRQRVDEKSQVTRYTYDIDDNLSTISYASTAVPTSAVTYTYDPNYDRLASITDGSGTTRYDYVPITETPSLGTGRLASVDGPLSNDTVTYGYDELGREVSRAINGISSGLTYDPAGRLTAETNPLGAFGYGYDGTSFRRISQTYPNGQTTEWGYGTTLQDHQVLRTTNKFGAAPLSEFILTRDIPRSGRVITWSQQAGLQTPSVFTFGYDAADELNSADATNFSVAHFTYGYDPAGNRLSEGVDGTTAAASYNTLNELTSTSNVAAGSVTNEWDGEQRLVAVNAGSVRTEFRYDGQGQRVGIRKLQNSSEVSNRSFVWCDSEICEERDSGGAVAKRFFPEGVKIETGPNAGIYFYTRDHLGSIREMTDSSGTVRARYSYDPFGRRTKVAGDLDADFGFAGMFWTTEAQLYLTLYRAYDPALGRWLSRDPLPDAEAEEGPNIYTYVANNPINLVDPLGLSCCEIWEKKAARTKATAAWLKCQGPALKKGWSPGDVVLKVCTKEYMASQAADLALSECERKTCEPKPKPAPPPRKPPTKPPPKEPPKKPPKCEPKPRYEGEV